MVGELDGGNPHVQFDEGAQETCARVTRLCPTLPKPLPSSMFDFQQVISNDLYILDEETGEPVFTGSSAKF